MKIEFSRRGLSYSLVKEEVTRVIEPPKTEDVIEKPFVFRILDGLPTIIFEPDGLYTENSSTNIGPWVQPNFLFVLRRDGDAGRAIFVDKFKRSFRDD
tara:strand:- start:138 stop:431 length:294 start_codon:yes stop_codon:yes gene_type:complete